MKPTTIQLPLQAQPELPDDHPIRQAAYRETLCILVVLALLFGYFVVTRASVAAERIERRQHEQQPRGSEPQADRQLIAESPASR